MSELEKIAFPEELSRELAQQLIVTYGEYQEMLAEKRKNTKDIYRLLEEGTGLYALTVYDARKIGVPAYICKKFTDFKVLNTNLDPTVIFGFREALKKLVDQRLALDEQYKLLTSEIVEIKQIAKDEGIPFISILQATDELGGEIVHSTAYALVKTAERRQFDRRLAKMAVYLLHKKFEMKAVDIADTLERSRMTVYNMIHGGAKLYARSDKKLDDLGESELLAIAKKNIPVIA